MEKINVLSTKIVSSSEKLGLDFDKINWVEHDFISISFLNFEFENHFDLLLFTSQNAVKSVLMNPKIEDIKKISCICVGEKTAELLRANGFVVIDYSHYAEDLKFSISKSFSSRKIAFFCGNLRRDVLPVFFKDNSIMFSEFLVYKNQENSVELNQEFNALVFYSPSGVNSYLQKNKISKHQVCFCIGTTTSEALLGVSEKVVISDKPTVSSLLCKVVKFFN